MLHLFVFSVSFTGKRRLAYPYGMCYTRGSSDRLSFVVFPKLVPVVPMADSIVELEEIRI